MTILFHNLPSVLGCAVCAGDPNSAVMQGANLAVALMGIVIFAVLGAIVAFAVNLARRERRMASEPDFAEELSTMDGWRR